MYKTNSTILLAEKYYKVKLIINNAFFNNPRESDRFVFDKIAKRRNRPFINSWGIINEKNM